MRRLSPTESTARVNVRVPESARDFIVSLGGNGRSAMSRGLRRLASLRMRLRDGEKHVLLSAREFAQMSTELERLRKVAK